MINQDCSEALIRESLQMRWFCDLEVQGEHSVDWLFKVKLIHVCLQCILESITILCGVITCYGVYL